ncbi:MAG TPA: bifunctional DNA primase/polymerase [Micromonosporaceae bacterium]|nr:bifunctional DNA primase/polymerase [Micromonosporaceae bacterium]
MATATTALGTLVTPLLAAALGYARAGIPVLPIHTPTPGGGCSCPDATCTSPGKHPRVRRGVHAATTDLSVLARWWARWPTANVGLRTGLRFDVCDVDAADARRALTAILGPGCARGPLAATGRGWHLWFTPTGAASRATIIDGVDWRGRDATVVAPPSLHVSGVRYRWLRDHHHLLPGCPPRLLALVQPPRSVTPYATGAVTHAGPYASAALAAETQRVRAARPPTAGSPGNRNDTLNRAAFNLGQLVGAGLLHEATAWGQLTNAALDAGLAPAEIRRTIASGLTAGQRHPRARPPR